MGEMILEGIYSQPTNIQNTVRLTRDTPEAKVKNLCRGARTVAKRYFKY
jgi:hypothetical protein